MERRFRRPVHLLRPRRRTSRPHSRSLDTADQVVPFSTSAVTATRWSICHSRLSNLRSVSTRRLETVPRFRAATPESLDLPPGLLHTSAPSRIGVQRPAPTGMPERLPPCQWHKSQGHACPSSQDVQVRGASEHLPSTDRIADPEPPARPNPMRWGGTGHDIDAFRECFHLRTRAGPLCFGHTVWYNVRGEMYGDEEPSEVCTADYAPVATVHQDEWAGQHCHPSIESHGG
jgi:hypothetical protein